MPPPLLAALLATGLVAAPSDEPRHLVVTCRVTEASPATVEISIRNASEHPLETHIDASLWLIASPLEERSSRPSVLLTAFDPKTGSSDGLFETGQTFIELPVGGSHSVEMDLTRLPWSLSPKDVEAPREFWELGAWGEYDLQVVVLSDPREPLEFGQIKSFPLRVRLPKK